MPQIDYLILTAANRAQALGYEAQLRARERHGMLGTATRWKVIPDPGGRRAGSGGSTLWTLFELGRALLGETSRPRSIRGLFEGKRIIAIHSGGDSRRLCAYAAQGKIFVPLPSSTGDGHPATLFDLVAASLADLPVPAGGQVLIAAGDLLLTFNRDDVDFNRPGVVGAAYPGPVERGSRHGVYVADRDGSVRDFLQKPDEQTARKYGAVDAVGRVLVDTGLISLDPSTVERLLTAAGVRLRGKQLVAGAGLLRDIIQGRCPAIDLYEQVLMAMAPERDLHSYLEAVLADCGGRPGGSAHRERLSHLYRALHGCPFHVNILAYCDFFHVGSSRELLANIGTLSRTSRFYRFANFDRSLVADRSSLEGAFVYNSILRSSEISAGDGVLLESVHTDRSMKLDGNNIVVGWPERAKTPLRLPNGWGLVCLPVRGGEWSAAVFGIDDDFKSPRGSGGTFGNRPLPEFLARHDLAPDALWTDSSPAHQTLWNAQLWCVGPIAQVLRDSLWMCCPDSLGAPIGWRRRRRVSMAHLLGLVDHARLMEHRSNIQRLGELHGLDQRLERNPWMPSEHVLSLIRSRSEAKDTLVQIDRMLHRREDPLQHARLYKLAQRIQQRFRVSFAPRPRLTGQALERAAFESVARAVAQQVAVPSQPRPAAILEDQVVWVTCPVRIDFSGGWSDTPPICTELGGAVLNAAVTLNGQYPVQVIAKLSQHREITLTSLDLGQRVEIRNTPLEAEYRDPSHWAALPKAALVLAGICPHNNREPLGKWLDRLGGGLEITLFSALPKGSGLGTSSILGAAMLACLARIVGEPVSNETITARTSMLEQMMTTAGGWQDQIGGITPGVKLIRTAPGPAQTPSLQWTVFDLSRDGPLRPRLLLYYSGYKRMAKNILQKIVGRYLARDPEAIAIVHQLKELAEQMRNDLGAGDVDAFGRGIENYWDLKKRLDPGSTNPQIERLLEPLNRFLTGKVLPGAGGGGFVFMVARDAECAARVRLLLNQNPPNSLARFFEFDIDQKGLSVTIL